MKLLSIGLALFGIIALVVAATGEDATTAVLGAAALLCAFTTFNATAISSFLKIFIGVFSTETIVFGLAVLAGRVKLWPADYAEYLPPESLRLTVARFWPFRRFTATERGVAIAMVVFLVLINQAQVGITVRLSFFNRDLFNALSNKDAAAFWHQLLFVF